MKLNNNSKYFTCNRIFHAKSLDVNSRDETTETEDRSHLPHALSCSDSFRHSRIN